MSADNKHILSTTNQLSGETALPSAAANHSTEGEPANPSLSFVLHPRCDICDKPTDAAEDDYGEIICPGCASDRAESAYERLCADFHDGGSSAPWPETERMRMEAARKFK